LASRLEVSTDPLRTGLVADGDADRVDIWWLGQAGFLLRSGAKRIVVDPYLSDSLARKYAGSRYPHRRMTPAPIAPVNLTPIDYVLVTHGHTDHMDPETLAPIAASNPACRFVVPAAEAQKAIDRGAPGDRLIAIDADERVALEPDLALIAVAAAHEEFKRDAAGRHFFLGYALCFRDRLTLYHSGDCVPYAGLDRTLARLNIDLALLPINGRDAVRLANGAPGNFTLREALALCDEAGIANMIGHHFGMFAENTVTVADARKVLAEAPHAVRATLAEIDGGYRLC